MGIVYQFRRIVGAFGRPENYPAVRDAMKFHQTECDRLSRIARRHLSAQDYAELQRRYPRDDLDRDRGAAD